MKIDNVKRIAREDLEGAPEWIDQLLDPLNNAFEQFTQTLRGQVDIANNTFVRKITQKVTDNVEVIIKNPFEKGLKPIGVVPIVSDSPYVVTGTRYDYKTDGQLGVTFTFGLAPSYIFLTRSANQLIPNAANTAIIWDTQQNNSGLFSWAAAGTPTRIVATTDGTYVFDYSVAFEPNVTGKRMCFIAKNGNVGATAQRFGQFDLVTNIAAENWTASGSALVTMAANDYIEVYCYQDSAIGLNALGNGTEEVQLTGHSLAYSGYSANVTFIVYGG